MNQDDEDQNGALHDASRLARHTESEPIPLAAPSNDTGSAPFPPHGMSAHASALREGVGNGQAAPAATDDDMAVASAPVRPARPSAYVASDDDMPAPPAPPRHAKRHHEETDAKGKAANKTQMPEGRAASAERDSGQESEQHTERNAAPSPNPADTATSSVESRFLPSSHPEAESTLTFAPASVSESQADSASGAQKRDAKPRRHTHQTGGASHRAFSTLSRDSQDFLHSARPRLGVIITCLAMGVACLALAALAYRLGVCTNAGQAFDALAWGNVASDVPGASALQSAVGGSALMLGFAGLVLAAAIAVAAVRHRWSCLVQIVVYAVLVFLAICLLKAALPRPLFDVHRPDPTNSAPSGHELSVCAAFVALLMAVPRTFRALTAFCGALASLLAGVCMMAGQWHRPTDIVMAIFIAAGLGFLVLAFSRDTGLDSLDSRRDSPSVQIVAPALTVLGLLLIGYGAYGIVQIGADLDSQPQWASGVVCMAALCLIAGSASLVFGLLCAMRQLTASPLRGSGIFGTPPRPPKKPRLVESPATPDAAFAPQRLTAPSES